MKELLVVVDMQTDFVSGSLGSEEAQKAVSAVEALVKSAENVVYTQDTHGDDYFETQEGKKLPVAHCLRGTKGWEILPSLYKEGSRIFEKGAFGSVELAEYVRKEKFQKITLCGVCTDICVVSNALLIKAFSPEAEVCVAANACAGVTVEKHSAALLTMQSCQIDVI